MMDDLRTRAQLVSSDHAGSIGTVVTRAELMEAAAGPEFPATLLLDLDRVEPAGGGEVTAHASVAVEWDRETLDQLLASLDDQQIELRFDARELARAFDDPEVEGHGLRERAAVLAVAAIAAGTSVSPALARVAADSGGAGSGAATTGLSVSAATGERSVPIGGAERALQQDEKLTQGLGAAGGQSAGFSVNPQIAGHGAVVQPAGAERALLQDEKVLVTQTHASMAGESATTSSSTLSSGELAGAVAGGLLLISAAGFGAARKRQPPVQPA
jgi:hypothetical protein